MFEVLCRNITAEDSLEVLNWRNDMASRHMSLNGNIISSTEHSYWFAKMLDSNLQIGIIGEINHAKIGVVFFMIDDNNARVSINLNPLERGKKLATILLRNAMEEVQKLFPQIDHFIAEIKNTNTASIKVFANNGYKLKTQQDGFGIYSVDSNNLGAAFDDKN